MSVTPLGIVARFMGSNDLAAVRSGRMDRSGASLTGVGPILGIIGTVRFAPSIIGALLWFAVLAQFSKCQVIVVKIGPNQALPQTAAALGYCKPLGGGLR